MEEAPPGGAIAQFVEVIGRNELTTDTVGSVVSPDDFIVCQLNQHGRQDVIVRAQELDRRVGDVGGNRDSVGVGHSPHPFKPNQAVRVTNIERLEELEIQDLEICEIDTDSQTQDEHRGSGESRCLTKTTKSMPKVEP